MGSSISYIAEILSDRAVGFPEVQIVFCDNRKLTQGALVFANK